MIYIYYCLLDRKKGIWIQIGKNLKGMKEVYRNTKSWFKCHCAACVLWSHWNPNRSISTFLPTFLPQIYPSIPVSDTSRHSLGTFEQDRETSKLIEDLRHSSLPPSQFPSLFHCTATEHQLQPSSLPPPHFFFAGSYRWSPSNLPFHTCFFISAPIE